MLVKMLFHNYMYYKSRYTSLSIKYINVLHLMFFSLSTYL